MKKLLSKILLAALVFSSCNHGLRVKNLDTYRKTTVTSANDKLKVGFVSTTKDPDSERIAKEVASELMKYSDKVLMSDANPSMSADAVDVWIKMGVTPKYEGSGWNFLINWPGFLIWTPAWHGYVYKVHYGVDVTMTEAKTNRQIDSFSLPFDLDIRHADIGRTWTEIGWLEVGLIPFIGGFVFTQYDDDISPLIADASKSILADNIAQEVVSRLNRGRLSLGK